MKKTIAIVLVFAACIAAIATVTPDIDETLWMSELLLPYEPTLVDGNGNPLAGDELHQRTCLWVRDAELTNIPQGMETVATIWQDLHAAWAVGALSDARFAWATLRYRTVLLDAGAGSPQTAPFVRVSHR